MADEEVDWDLNAVVRSFSTTAAAATRSSSSTAIKSDNLLPCFTSVASLDVGNGSQSQNSGPFGFPELLKQRTANGFDELQQLFRPYFISSENNGNSSSYGHMQKQQGCTMNMPPQIMIQPPPQSTAIFPGGVFRGGKQPQLPVPVQSQTSRSRKRKNQVKKSVCHVTGENLSSDLWAWRKYGQKPIKGSPFPRNYYRCSSSKGCTARKQVEKSTTDENVFIVTYTGEHSHPRPTHRNSLAGSTRNKFTNTLLKPIVDAAPEITSAGNEDFKPPFLAVSDLSPTTPLTAPVMIEEPVLSMDEMDDDGMEEDDDLLIPNVMSEDFFMFGASPYNSSGHNFPSSQR